jgi:putative membrane protein
VTEAPSADGGGWQHLHPLSPLLRGGVAFVAVVGYLVSQQFDRIFGGRGDDPTQGHRLLAAGIVALVLLAIVAGSWVSWRFSRFRVGTAMLELRTGLLFRQHRQVHFDRIQAVDVARPVLARLTGLSEVVVQSAGGHDSSIKLAFLTDTRAREVQEQLMALAGHTDEVVPLGGAVAPNEAIPLGGEAATQDGETGARPWDAAGPSAPQPGRSAGPLVARPVVRVPNARFIQSMLYSGVSGFLLLAVPSLVVVIVLGIPGVVAWLGPLVLGTGGTHLKRFVTEANFTLHHRGDSLLVRHGLTELRSTTVPLHRIQAAELSQPLLWRLPGWWRLRVNVAGAGGGDGPTETLLLPVGTLAEALAVLDLVRPGIPTPLALAALQGEGADHGFVTASHRARLLDPLSWRRRGYAVTPDCVVLRGGAIKHVAQVVPHARVQSLRVEQGPLQRARGVASVRLVSTPGPVKATAAHLDVAEAQRLLGEQVARSARARQWA